MPSRVPLNCYPSNRAFLISSFPARRPARCARWTICCTYLERTSAVFSGSAQGNRTSRSEEHTSELQSLMRISYAVFCLKKKKIKKKKTNEHQTLRRKETISHTTSQR